MTQDRLLLLQPGFADGKQPGERFVCPECLPVEGLLAAAPELASRLQIEWLPYERPRAAAIAAQDEAHQSLPVLILGDEIPTPLDVQSVGSARFVTDTRRIFALLAERHGFPQEH